nr:MAG TPA: hypothetical protein [Caudoviricetes sp.]
MHMLRAFIPERSASHSAVLITANHQRGKQNDNLLLFQCDVRIGRDCRVCDRCRGVRSLFYKPSDFCVE